MKNNRFKTQTQRKRTSLCEKEIGDILSKLFPGVVYYYEYPYSLFTNTENNRLKADIYCKTFGVVFEYQGEHHSKIVTYGKQESDFLKAKKAFEDRQELDKLKRELCTSNNIRLIEIWRDDWAKLKTYNDKVTFIWDLIG